MEPQVIAVVMLVLAGIIAVFAGAYFGFKKLKKMRIERIGKNGEKIVAKALNKIAKKRKFIALHDLYLPLYDKTTQVDHIIVGPFGMVVVETKALNGEIYGNEGDKEWTHIIGQQRHKLYNPLSQNKAHIDCISHLLKKENVYRVQVDSLVVFAGKNIQLGIQKGLPVITLSLLKKYFKKPRYQADNGVNVEKVKDVLLKYRVTDKELLKQHNNNVKEMAKAKK